MTEELLAHQNIPVKMELDGASYYAPSDITEAVSIRSEKIRRLIAGATDLGVQINKETASGPASPRSSAH